MHGISLKKSLISIFILIVALFLLTILVSKTKVRLNGSGYHLIVKNNEINLIIASTTESKELGLGGRESLPDNTAMLFTFERPYRVGIWMKDMKIPIDIFWLNEKREIITIYENISPDTYPEVFSPVGNSSFVLETNAGFAKKNNLKVGNFLNLILK